METNPKYRSRTSAAWWSKTVLAVASVVSVLLLPFGFDWSDALIVAGVLTVTYFEFRVHHYFATGDPRGPSLGFRNQSFFAAGILLYGLVNAAHPPPVPDEYQNMLDASTIDLVQGTIQKGYLAIGIAGGLSQFWLAWYYRMAQVKP